MFGPVHALHPAAQAAESKNNNYANGNRVAYLLIQFPDESENVPTLQVSLVHTLGAVPRRVSGALHVKQCAELAGLEQVAQESSHTVWR